MPIARYIDWITTTPILMYELGHLAHASTADTLMLVGYAAQTARRPTTYTTYYHLRDRLRYHLPPATYYSLGRTSS